MGKFSKIAKIAVGALAGIATGGLAAAAFGAAGLGAGALTATGTALFGGVGALTAGATGRGGGSPTGLPPIQPLITGGAEVRRGGKTTARQYIDPATGNIITEYLPTPEEEASKALNEKLLNMALGKLADPGAFDTEIAGLTKAFEEEQRAQLAEPFRAQEQAAVSEITRLGARASPYETQLRTDVAKKQAEVGLSLGRQTKLLHEDLRSRRNAELQNLVQLARSGLATEADIARANKLEAERAREFEIGANLQRENLALGREALIEETRARKRENTAQLGLLGLLAGRDLLGFGKKV